MRAVSASQMRRMDRAATTRYGMPVFLLMENAGRAVAEAVRTLAMEETPHPRPLPQGARELLDISLSLSATRLRRTRQRLSGAEGRGCRVRVIVLCGSGHNGGDGVVAARYLRGWGIHTHVWWLKDPRLWEDDIAMHYRIAKRFGVFFTAFSKIPSRQRIQHLRRASVIVDALLGTGTQGRPHHLARRSAPHGPRSPSAAGQVVGEIRGLYREAIACINDAKRPARRSARLAWTRRPTVAVDIPSGLDADKGIPLGIAVRADVTVTMAAAKTGLLKPSARPYVGKLVVADIGFPRYPRPLGERGG